MYCAFKKSRVFQFLTFIVQITGTQHSSRIALVLLYYNVWLVQKTRTTLSTNQIKNKKKKQSRLSHPRFPALWTVFLFLFWALIGSLKYLSSSDWPLCNHFGFGFTSLERRSIILYKATEQLFARHIGGPMCWTSLFLHKNQTRLKTIPSVHI